MSVETGLRGVILAALVTFPSVKYEPPAPDPVRQRPAATESSQRTRGVTPATVVPTANIPNYGTPEHLYATDVVDGVTYECPWHPESGVRKGRFQTGWFEEIALGECIRKSP